MSDAATRIESDVPTLHVSDAPSTATGARFTPGTTVANRYRIIALLGSGGMGEVYRAEDLRLQQQVALKFLPPAFAAQPGALEHLLAEVRLGRQISHPNVCRLYDIVEVDGHYFIAMEYVDGEDLASLLRRVGKLPAEKVVAIARDLFSGLAAVHDHGVVHRDIKPANVMLDSRGRARLTDFGVAAVAAELASGAEIAGTPAYMAPEQLSGDLVTPRSDLYSVALMLFELFTGKRLFEGNSAPEIANEHNTPKPRISTMVAGVDPAIERVILRCLSEDPAERPASAREVLRELPTDDPLAAALDAGETPSPALVAAAGEVGTVSARTGAMWLGGFVLALLAAAFVFPRAQVWGRVASKSIDALDDRASEVVRLAGYDPRALHRAQVWVYRADGWRWLRDRGMQDDLDAPSPLYFVQRISASPIKGLTSRHRVALNDPPDTAATGYVVLDAQGRLVFFEAPSGAQRIRAPQLDALAAATRPQRGGIDLRIASRQEEGALTSFEALPPWRSESLGVLWTRPDRSAPASAVVDAFMSFLSLVVTALLAFWNFRAGRVDRKGAIRVAMFVFSMTLAAFVFYAEHDISAGEWRVVQDILGVSLYYAAITSLAYVAIEPYLRRIIPHSLVASSRLLAGRWRDPLVARDVLIGLTLGTLAAAIEHLPVALSVFTRAPIEPIQSFLRAIEPLDLVAHTMLFAVVQAIYFGLVPAVIYVALRRSSPPAVAATLIGLTFLVARFPATINVATVACVALYVAILMFTLARYGPLAFTAMWLSVQLIARIGLTLDFSAWYAGRSMLVMALLSVLALYGWRFASARTEGRSLPARAAIE